MQQAWRKNEISFAPDGACRWYGTVNPGLTPRATFSPPLAGLFVFRQNAGDFELAARPLPQTYAARGSLTVGYATASHYNEVPGIGGLIQKWIIPRLLLPAYHQELANLEAHAQALWWVEKAKPE